MKLEEWSKRSGIKPRPTPNGGVVIVESSGMTNPFHAELWQLSDYKPGNILGTGNGLDVELLPVLCLSEQLQAMYDLKPDWDGFGTYPPQPATITAAGNYIRNRVDLKSRPIKDVFVHPGQHGNVIVGWKDDTCEYELDFLTDGTKSLTVERLATGETWIDKLRE